MQSEAPVPTMWELLFPVLDAVRRLGGTAANAQIDKAMIASEGFTGAQLESVGPNGRRLIPYRIAWARSYLKKAGLLDNTERAVWRVTDRGTAVNADEMLRLVKAASDRSRGEEVQKGRSVSIVATPDGGGVDGVVVEDELGMRRLYCQAKRNAKSHPVGPGEIRDFIGALDIKRRHEGVFVTTSRFTQEARQAVELSSKHVSLIDGQYLSELMPRYDIAVASHPFVFKQADPEYFN